MFLLSIGVRLGWRAAVRSEAKRRWVRVRFLESVVIGIREAFDLFW